jgi:endonuclease V-like protein UPF0215 family
MDLKNKSYVFYTVEILLKGLMYQWYNCINALRVFTISLPVIFLPSALLPAQD